MPRPGGGMSRRGDGIGTHYPPFIMPQTREGDDLTCTSRTIFRVSEQCPYRYFLQPDDLESGSPRP
jgi:hypothetical protein